MARNTPSSKRSGVALGAAWRSPVAVALAALLTVGLAASDAGAAPAPPAAAAARGAPAGKGKPKAAATAPAKPRARPRTKAKPKAPAVTPAPAASAPPAAPEAPVGDPTAKPASDVVKTEQAGAGEKTYTFGAQEVEGRLKSPQILYFLRRVRAQFDPAPLGHRSFLLELSDTRRHPAFE